MVGGCLQQEDSLWEEQVFKLDASEFRTFTISLQKDSCITLPRSKSLMKYAFK
jgi:hypothetical protein